MNNYKNSGWILCPSKRFPGKFYYYNVLNGESAWSFNETQKELFKIVDKTHVSQKSHRYPEPASPPDKSPYILARNRSASPQTFGHATFPKYINTNNIKWTTVTHLIKSNKPSIRDIDIHTYLPKKDILVESSKEPLSQRFLKYQLTKNNNKNVLLTKVHVPYVENIEDTTDNLWSGFTVKKSNFNNFGQPETSIKSTKRKYIEYSAVSNDNSVQSKNKFIKKYTEKSTLTDNGKVEEIYFDTETNQKNLDNNDLRYILQAKRSRLDSNKADVDLSPSVKKKNATFNIENSKQVIVTRALNGNTQALVNENDKNVDVREKYNLKNIKMTAKNETHNNFFLQSAKELRPFLLDDEERPLGANFKDAIKYEKENAHTNLSRGPMKGKQFLEFRNNFDQIVTDDDLTDIVNNITDKLQIKKYRHAELLITDNGIKSRREENPFRYLTKPSTTGVSLSKDKRNKSGITISVPNSNINNEHFKNIENNHFQLTTNENIRDIKFRCFDSEKTNPFSNLPSVSDFHSTNRSEFWQNTRNVPKLNMTTETDELKKKEYSVEDKLRGFYTRNKIKKGCVILRMDELICCFTQIMEDFIYNTIETSSCPPPYSFREAFLYLRKVCSHTVHTKKQEAVDKIIELNIFCPKTGYIQHNIQPNVIIKAIGYGLLLVDAFKEFQVHGVQDAENALLQLLTDIEDPKFLDMPEPTVSGIRDFMDSDLRQNFIKSRSDISLYLQKHFPNWRSHDDPPGNDGFINNNIHKIDKNKAVLRTSGQNLHLFKINSNNQLSMDEVRKNIDEQRVREAKVMRTFKTIDKFEKRVNESHFKSEDMRDIKVNTKHANENNETRSAGGNKDNCKKGDIETYKRTNDSWKNRLRYSKNLPIGNSEIDDLSGDRYNELHKIHNLNSVPKGNAKTKIVKEKTEVNKDNKSHLNIEAEFDDENYSNYLKIDETKDIAKDNKSQQCYELLKRFLIRLSATLQLIYSFVEESLHRFANGDVKQDYKKALHEETNNTYIYLKQIIENLKSIIDRETKNEIALRILVVCADAALSDKRVTRYRQIVSKCLEQARIMENSLKMLLNLTDNNCSMSVNMDLCDTYINIFE